MVSGKAEAIGSSGQGSVPGLKIYGTAPASVRSSELGDLEQLTT